MAAVVYKVYSLQAVSVHVSTLHNTVLKCTDSEQMLRWMIKGVSRLDRIRNADEKGTLNYVRRRQHNRKQRLEEMSNGRVTKFIVVRSQENFERPEWYVAKLTYQEPPRSHQEQSRAETVKLTHNYVVRADLTVCILVHLNCLTKKAMLFQLHPPQHRLQ